MPPSKPSTLSKSNPDEDFPTHTFHTQEAFTTFLSQHSTTLPGLYLKLAKRHTSIPSITAQEAIDVALCHGWIDGRSNSIDDQYWTVRYTPRRAKSIWSWKNVQTVERLTEEGRMTEEGLRRVEEAKEDGRWERAYRGRGEMSVPQDLQERIEGGGEEVRRGWEGLGKGERWSLLFRLGNLKSVKGREKALREVVERLRKEDEGGNGDSDEVGEEKVVKKAAVKNVVEKERAGKGDKPTGVVKKSTVKKQTVSKSQQLKRAKFATSALEEAAQPRREGLRRRP